MISFAYMDTIPTVENSTVHTRKIISLSIIGVVVGLIVGAGAMFYYYQNAVFFNSPDIKIEGLSYPNPDAQKVPDINLKNRIVLPKSMVNEEYYTLINKIVDDLRIVGNNNVSTLIPLLETIKQKSAVRDFNGFFDLITQAKNEIAKNTALLDETRIDIANLKKISDTSVKDADVRNKSDILLASSDVFVREFLSYFDLVNKTLSGSFPTQSLLDRLTSQVTIVGTSAVTVQNDLSALLATIKQKSGTAPSSTH